MGKMGRVIMDLIPFILGIGVVCGISVYVYIWLKGGVGLSLSALGVFGGMIGFCLLVEIKRRKKQRR